MNTPKDYFWSFVGLIIFLVIIFALAGGLSGDNSTPQHPSASQEDYNENTYYQDVVR